jgi:heme A synthase
MGKRYTASELDARLKFGVGITLAAVLFTTTVAILYALVFVTQPIGEQAENDKMFFSVLSSIATFITGTLAGLMIGQNKAAVDPDPVLGNEEEPVFEEGEERQ